MVYNLYKINDETIQLALQIETIRNMSFQKRDTSTSVNDDGGSEDNELLDFIEMPRKQTIFRVVMEKKLGIDWEHNDEYDDNSNKGGAPRSVQTEQMFDGYNDAQS